MNRALIRSHTGRRGLGLEPKPAPPFCGSSRLPGNLAKPVVPWGFAPGGNDEREPGTTRACRRFDGHVGESGLWSDHRRPTPCRHRNGRRATGSSVDGLGGRLDARRPTHPHSRASRLAPSSSKASCDRGRSGRHGREYAGSPRGTPLVQDGGPGRGPAHLVDHCGAVRLPRAMSDRVHSRGSCTGEHADLPPGGRLLQRRDSSRTAVLVALGGVSIPRSRLGGSIGPGSLLGNLAERHRPSPRRPATPRRHARRSRVGRYTLGTGSRRCGPRLDERGWRAPNVTIAARRCGITPPVAVAQRDQRASQPNAGRDRYGPGQPLPGLARHELHLLGRVVEYAALGRSPRRRRSGRESARPDGAVSLRGDTDGYRAVPAHQPGRSLRVRGFLGAGTERGSPKSRHRRFRIHVSPVARRDPSVPDRLDRRHVHGEQPAVAYRSAHGRGPVRRHRRASPDVLRREPPALRRPVSSTPRGGHTHGAAGTDSPYSA